MLSPEPAHGSVPESLLRLLFEQAPGFIVVLEGPRHVVTLANPAYYRLVGKRDLIGRPLGEAIPEAVAQGFTRLLDEVLVSGQPFIGKRLPVRLGRTAGDTHERRYVDFVYQPVLARDGRVAGIFCEGHDVTEHVEAEAKLLHEAMQREAQSRVFDALLSSIDDFAYTFDREHRFTYANKPLLDLLGLDLATITGKTFFELPYPPELAADLDAKIGSVLATGERVRGQTYYAAPTGEEGWYEYIFSPVIDAEGATLSVAGSTRNITGRVEQERRLAALNQSEREARAAAEQAGRMKDEFLATLSHELRTPLNAILGWSELLRTGRIAGHQVTEAAERISRNSRAQARLIADLLDMNGIVSGKVRLSFERVPLERPVAAALDAVRPDALKKGVAVHGPSAGASVLVECDPDRLQQVLWNLLINAVKFTPAGGTVALASRVHDGSLTITVTDNGAGLAPGFVPRMFERFSQADSSSTRSHGGLGLGLSICRSLVELHGGRIAATSEGTDRGSTFDVTLPLSQGPGQSVPDSCWGEPSQLDVPACEDADTLRGERILVVDDDDEGRDLVAALLRRCGATVTTACDAAEALGAAEAQRQSLLLCDIGMPVVDGYELLRRLRRVSTAPAIALTAFARPEDRQRALASGFIDHIAKPADPASVVAACVSALRAPAA